MNARISGLRTDDPLDGEYHVSVQCGNCEEEFTVMVKKGTKLLDALIDLECENCGCCELERY